MLFIAVYFCVVSAIRFIRENLLLLLFVTFNDVFLAMLAFTVRLLFVVHEAFCEVL